MQDSFDRLKDWGPWIPLYRASRHVLTPRCGGLYQIRRVEEDVVYIGQSGDLRERMSHVQGAFKDLMPYRDPHTSAPALWALRDQARRSAQTCDFEVSFCPLEGDAPHRKAWECVAIAQHRQLHHHSPILNFGQMPDGYRMSTGNNANLVKRGVRSRGGYEGALLLREPGVEPLGELATDPMGAMWCGLSWAPWERLERAFSSLPAHTIGLYRIRHADHGLMYVGEGKIRDRLKAHRRKSQDSGNPQAAFFGLPGLQVSWVTGLWSSRQRLELETDCIAAHVLKLGAQPKAQFLDRVSSDRR